MFNRTFVIPVPATQTHYHTTTEKRAPTDESVRLLKEMEQAAQSKVDQSIRLEVNGFECVVHVFRDYPNDLIHARAQFALAGRVRQEVEFSIRSHEKGKELASGLVKAISDRIARECLQDFVGKFVGRYNEIGVDW